MSHCYARLCVLSFALAIALTWGLGVLVAGLGAACYGWGAAFVDVLGSIYIGYAPTVGGSFIGFLWGFVDGFIGGAIFALLYNYFTKCCERCCARWCKPCEPKKKE